MSSRIKIRQATANDLPEIQELFVGSVKQVAKKDYSTDQLEVWASSIQNTERWQKAISEQYFLVAVSGKLIVGFASLDQGHYIDFLYVHKDYQRRGVADTIYQKLEQEAIHTGQTEITTNASKTALPFFLARGFIVIRENSNQIRGVEIVNYHMKKSW